MRSLLCATIFSVVLCQAARAADVGFNKLAKPFFSTWCLDCHDNDTREGDVSLQDLGDVTAQNVGMWKRVWEQVALKEMPPRDEENQPELKQRLNFSNWITGGLVRAMEGQGGFSDHLRPIKGNHIDHDLFFGIRHEHLKPASTPARLWRIHPQEQLVRLNDLVSRKRVFDPERPGVYTHGDHIPANLVGQVKVFIGLDRRTGGAMVPQGQRAHWDSGEE